MAGPAVELLYIRNSAGPYTIVNALESSDGSPVRWGKNERPPLFAVIRVYARLRDIPPEWLERDCARSRFKVNEEAMSEEERRLITAPARFVWSAQPVKHTLDLNRLSAVLVDDSDVWIATQLQEYERRAATAALSRVGR